MQDFSRDDYAGCDKETIISDADSQLEQVKLATALDLDTPTSISMKLDDAGDVFPWHTTSTNIGSNLL